MSDLPFVVFATVAVVAVGYAALGVASIFLSHRLDRVMARTPRPTIADLSGRDLPPLGRVSGTVVAGLPASNERRCRTRPW